MNRRSWIVAAAAGLLILAFGLPAWWNATRLRQAAWSTISARWPVRDGMADLRHFRFQTGETMGVLRLHYFTLGSLHRDAAGRVDNAVLLLHAAGSDGSAFLSPTFADVLFGPGQPLDIQKYFLIVPDAIGHGGSSKPSDGLRMRFPAYDVDDMVLAQHEMLLQTLHVDHLRLILGSAMGCMQTFVWGETFSAFADALAPMACLPIEVAGRTRMVQDMAIDAIRTDPAWRNGAYRSPPAAGLRLADEFLFIMASSAASLQKAFPTRIAADKGLEASLSRSVGRADANDLIFALNAGRNYNPLSRLPSITAPVLWINAADDFSTPPELGVADRLARRMARARYILLAPSERPRANGVPDDPALWKTELERFLAEAERR